jgi:hypothetical protein
MNERSFIVKSYSAIYHIFSPCLGGAPLPDSGEAQPPAVACVAAASDRADARAKHVPAVYFKISYPALSSQRDAKQPA